MGNLLDKLRALWVLGAQRRPVHLRGEQPAHGSFRQSPGQPAKLFGDDRDYTPPSGAHRIWMGKTAKRVILTPAVAAGCCFVSFLDGDGGKWKTKASPFYLPANEAAECAKTLIAKLGELRPVIDMRFLYGLWPGTDEPPPWEYNRLAFNSRDAWLRAGAPSKSPI